MRNEGPFIVEWVCWYRMLGFDILVATNDCTDHSTELLDALADAGWLTHVPHKPRTWQPPQRSTLRKVIKHPLTAATDWTLHCDVDEFLVLHQHNTIAELMGPPPYNFMAMVFNRKCFGQGDGTTIKMALCTGSFDAVAWGICRSTDRSNPSYANPWNLTASARIFRMDFRAIGLIPITVSYPQAEKHYRSFRSVRTIRSAF